MKFASKIKTLMVAAAAVFILAGPAYSWTYQDDHGWNHRRYDNYRWENRAYRGDYDGRWHRHDRHWPAHRPADSFVITLPGFFFHVGR